MSERKVILKMVMSLDGFATSADGTHEWMFEWFGEDSNAWSRRALEEAGVHAMGRRSYEIMGPHWAASDGPIATAMNDKPKAVFSRTLEKAEWGPVEIFGGDPADDGPDRDRHGPKPVRRAGRAPEAGRRRRGALLEWSAWADPGAQAIVTPCTW
jgi:hypothetical protein